MMLLNFYFYVIIQRLLTGIDIETLQPSTSILKMVVSEGNETMFNYFIMKAKNKGIPIYSILTSTVADTAARHGHLLFLLKFDLFYNIKPTTYGINQAARNDHLHIVQHLKHLITINTMNSAACAGALLTFKYVHKYLHIKNPTACLHHAITLAYNMAAIHNHPCIMEYINSTEKHKCSVMTVQTAANRGHLEVLKYIFKHNHYILDVDDIASNGNLEVLKYIYRKNCMKCTPRAANLAALYGYYNIIIYLANVQNVYCSQVGIDNIVLHGQLDMVKFVHNCGIYCTYEGADRAAGCGYLVILQYIMAEQHIYCTSWGVTAASVNGHLHILKYLANNPYCILVGTETDMNKARNNGYEEVADFIENFL